MSKKFTINELIKATNDILITEIKKKKLSVFFNIKDIKNAEIQKKNFITNKFKQTNIEKHLLIKNKDSTITSSNSSELSGSIDNNINPDLVNELYELFKKKVKKKTLKIIIDQQLEAKNFENSINLLNNNINDLQSKYKNLQINIDDLSKERSILISENKILIDKCKNSNKEITILEKNMNNFASKLNRTINEKNTLSISNKDLKNILVKSTQNNKLLLNSSKKLHANLCKFVNNNKKLKIDNEILHNNIIELNNNYEKNNKLNTDRIKELESKIDDEPNNNLLEEANNKLKFYQDENVRLSSELVSTNERLDILKSNISKIEIDKNDISTKIQALNDTLNNTNIVNTPFSSEKSVDTYEDLKKINNNDKNNLGDIINKIFNKK